MLEQMQGKQLVVVEEPIFSAEFVDVMIDYAYERLRAKLEAIKGGGPLVELLDDLVILESIQNKNARGAPIWEQWNYETGLCIARISQQVVKQGGSFVGPTWNERPKHNK